ncbi:MAG: NADH-ubiquinone oxidoreductase chain D, partial [uncultured Thermomicrobiales bacterium]
DGDRRLLPTDPGRARRAGLQLPAGLPEAAAGVFQAAHREPDLDGADQGRRYPHPRGCYLLLADGRLPARIGRQLRRPQGDSLPRLRSARFRGSAGPVRRHLRPIPDPDGGDAPVDQADPAGARPRRAHGHAVDGLRVALRDPPAQGHDDDRRGHAAALHLGAQGLQPAGRR